MKRALICLVLSAFVVTAAAQQQTINIEGKVSSFDLEAADYIVERIPLRDKQGANVRITDVTTRDISQLPPGAKASNSFEPDVFTATERKEKLLLIKIPAYKKLNGKVEQLESYNLDISYPAGDTKQENVPFKTTEIKNSVLASGKWYKIAVAKKGIYKIDHAFLTSLGLNPSTINPAHIQIFGNGGTVMSETVDSSQPTDLIENAVFVSSSSSSFGADDYVLFYANGPVKWEKDDLKAKFNHTNNYYEDRSYYFLTIGPGTGKRIESESAVGNATTTYTSFDDYKVIDLDSFSIGKMGKIWWSHKMSSLSANSSVSDISIDLGSVEGPVLLDARVGNENEADGNLLRLTINGQQIHDFTLGSNGQYFFLRDGFISKTFAPSSPKLHIKLQYFPRGTGAAYLDYLEFNYKRPLAFGSGQMSFRNLGSTELSSTENARYQIKNAGSNMQVWEVTNPLKPISLNGSLNGNQFEFVRAGGELKEFIAFDGSSFLKPTFVGSVDNQNLHGLGPTDLLIITNKQFLPAANRLADFHKERSNMKVTVALVDQIYNEFSSGGQDIAGIRNFIKMFYDRAQNDEERIKNVLFFGAASYDYKNRINNNTNFVPTYQTLESQNSVGSYSSDDFYGLLDEGERMSSGSLLDVGLGRIPVFTLEEAELAVDKIKHYASPASFGPWKNVVSFVADDKELGMNHLQDCEVANSYFNDTGKQYNLYKIYSDAFPMVAGSAGARYPGVNKAINDQIYNGTFLMSYSGHGNPKKWAHEEILTADDYDNWTNRDKLPVMITGTCDFGRFDDPHQRSAGAKLMLKPNGGSIAMITTTQAVYPDGNRRLTRSFIENQFEQDAKGNWKTLGEALTAAKNQFSQGGENNHKFTILGDPALTLQFPKHQVVTDSLFVEHDDGSLSPVDTINALGKYVLKGSVTNKSGGIIHDFSGDIYVTIFDKANSVQTINPFPGTTPSFRLQTNVVARIKSHVNNGKFSVRFLVPKDINYDFGSGKVSYYAQSEETDASGMDDNLVVGGFNANAPDDNAPPVVDVYIDNDKFRDGGITGPNPLLYVKLFDDNGINVSGTSIGHDLVAILDEDIQNPMVMNDYYQTEEDDYRNGFVYFPLYNLPDGMHTIRVKAWDSYNNSGEGVVRFEVKNPDRGFIGELYNYPNPVTSGTRFVFQHNQKGENLSVSLQIFDMAGGLVRNIHRQLRPEGNRTEIEWDGLGDTGNPLARGVYSYRLVIKTEAGITAKAYEKLVLLR